jgi:AraC family transcriptional regulator
MTPPTWQIPLDQPPRVVSMARHAHGFVPSDRYRLPDLWSLHLYSYNATLRLDGREVAIRPGMLGVTPPGTLMETRYYGLSVHLFAHFQLPAGPTRPISALVDTGEGYDSLYDDLFEAIGQFSQEPSLASVRVWHALWKAVTLSDGYEGGQRASHRAVRLASEAIEQRLAGKIAVADLAHLANVTPSYLTRLFQEAYGESIVGHVRRRRMERASELLQRSNLPIKMVAATVGFSDLQQFNKAVRTHFGVSPREWRSHGKL